MLKEMKDLEPIIQFPKLRAEVLEVQVWTFSNAAFNIVSPRDYGQSGIIVGILPRSVDGEEAFHVVDWASTTQKRVSHSAYGADILACSDADDRGYRIKESIRSITSNLDLPHILHVDSRGLFDTISTLHDGREYRLRQTAQRIRDSFEGKEIDVLRWVPSRQNIADCLTKRCPQAQRKFNKICVSGRMSVDTTEARELSTDTWK